jgi:hypothetical protein
MRNFLVAVMVLGLLEAVAAGAQSSPRDATPWPRSSAPLLVIPHGGRTLFEGRAGYETNWPAPVRRYHIDDVPPIG